MKSSLEPIGLGIAVGGAIILRQVVVGRAEFLASDTRDFMSALVHGNGSALAEVASRRGKNLPSAQDVGVAAGGTVGPISGLGSLSQSANGDSLVTEMKRLAAIAQNRYIFGAEGPAGYDCSGLVWRALKNLGIYTGSRFTTFTFPTVAKSFAEQISTTPAYGDIVLWQGLNGHMGVVTGNNQMFSALNSRVGIVTSTITGTHSGTPTYWRLIGNAVSGQSPIGPGQVHTQN